MISRQAHSRSADYWQANLELSHTYGLLNSSDQSLLLADLEALKTKEVQFALILFRIGVKPRDV
jgi:hypothetical protein